MNKWLKIWEYKDLRNKIIVAISLLLLTRVLAHIPLPGVDLARLQTFFSQNQVFGFLNMFSGGTMSNFSIILMGVGPYITSSIIFQLLGMIFPAIEELQKEGEAGRQKITQWTRLATIPLAFIQAYAMLVLLRNQGVIPTWTTFDLWVMLISVTAGTILLMWLGEIISQKGIGNGVSLIITLGILSSYPSQIRNTALILQSGDTTKIIGAIAFAIIFVLATIGIIIVQEGQRNIPVTYARKLRLGQTTGYESTLPIRVNIAGVIPIIFAMSVLVIPGVVAKYLEAAKTAWLANSATSVSNFFNNQTYYAIIYFVLVFAFTFFYTFIVFKPTNIAENLQKQSGFIPGIRPGTETREYIYKVISRITFVGAAFLSIIAVLPFIVQSWTGITTFTLGGTGILIVVAVVLETMGQIESQMSMHTYERY
ncbi:preprotein translocase subunit SecY [Candidatus Berkelbacteria bacterium CG10_big_fil_rev_8_21_14_0_10_43_13]|uniref:Protein translocase subunit SecY n=1 Tax=Candidatus Berkelbacteria bacterium CG10_big_fil_rev_8_21_14_0_10_43_13 TaxID=1974514 RepID=A0A2H0W887_9BACT|nr:MAG: preprotein translocase subunit SecY [Candidatus Berkelbacteria bacterium CG10_big_fil_rev_8_21_14_0_10_43_13]